MTTSVFAHLPPAQKDKRLVIETFDRVYDHEAQRLTNDWKKVNYVFVEAGGLYQTYCTDTRRVLISEVPVPALNEES